MEFDEIGACLIWKQKTGTLRTVLLGLCDYDVAILLVQQACSLSIRSGARPISCMHRPGLPE